MAGLDDTQVAELILRNDGGVDYTTGDRHEPTASWLMLLRGGLSYTEGWWCKNVSRIAA
jgi:hypothetical protein